MITITEFAQTDQLLVRAFVLHIQNSEFNLGFTVEEQPDLLHTASFYQNGGFWVAKQNDQLVGTIGLQKLDEDTGILRKLFVHQDVRGKQLGVAQALFEQLIKTANALNIKQLYLDTPAIAVASHKFYERNGFATISRNDIPVSYSFPDRDSKIYRLSLKAGK